jgi:hypothetical protein
MSILVITPKVSPMDPLKQSHRVVLLLALALGAFLGFAGRAAWNPTRDGVTTAKPHTKPLGVTRQQLLDSLGSVFTLEPVEKKPTLCVVKLGGSTATVAIQGAADAPNKANVTAVYTSDSAPVIATAASRGRLLAL